MHPEDTEYTSLRTEIMHYDKACLTILGFLLVLSTSVYGLVAEKAIFSLLLVLSIVWSVGFRYILDKRTSILRIALYLQVYFESSTTRGFWWESWLTCDGVRTHQKCPGVKHAGLRSLPAQDPIYVEFFLLLLTLFVNVVWMWMLSPEGAQVTSLTAADPQLLVQSLSVTITVGSLISAVWNYSLMMRYLSFKKQEYFDACRSQN